MNRPTRFSLPRMICVWTSTTLTMNSASMARLDLDLVGVEATSKSTCGFKVFLGEGAGRARRRAP